MTTATAPAAAAPVVAPKGAVASLPDSAPAEKPSEPVFKGTKHKVKLEGKELEVDYDELVRGYQNTQVSNKRYQEAAKLAAEAKKIDSALESGDVSYLVQKLGPQKARTVMENYLIEQMQYEQLPPHEKALRSEKEKSAALERQIKERDEAGKQDKYLAQANKAYQDLDQEMGEALTAIGKKPNPRLALRLLEQIEARLIAKEERIPAKDAWPHAKRALVEDIRFIAPELTVDELHEMLGQDVVKKLMAHKVDQVLDAKQNRRTKAPESVKAPEKPRSIDDHYKELEQKLMKRR